MTIIKLYSYYRSSASYRVRIALGLKNLKYETIPINLLKDGGEQHSKDYAALNALNQVPTIDIDGVVLTQSISIIEYIDEKFTGGAKLLPGDAVQRAQARRIAEIVNSGIQPLQNLSTLKVIAGEPQVWAQHVIQRGFKAIELILAHTAGTFCVGDEVSIADISLVPQVFNANRFKVDMAQFPTISRINEALCRLEVFQAASPSRQPDCPEDER